MCVALGVFLSLLCKYGCSCLSRKPREAVVHGYFRTARGRCKARQEAQCLEKVECRPNSY